MFFKGFSQPAGLPKGGEMLLNPPSNCQVEPKIVVLAPLLAHLGALGRHLGFNLVHLGAKLGAKMHLNGLSQKSFLKVFAGMASRTPPKIIQEAGGLREALIKARTLCSDYSGSEYFLYMRTARGKVGSKNQAAVAPKGGWRMTGSAIAIYRGDGRCTTS